MRKSSVSADAGVSPQENSVMRSSATPAVISSSCLKSDTWWTVNRLWLQEEGEEDEEAPTEIRVCHLEEKDKEEKEEEKGLHRLHGSSSDDHGATLPEYLGEVDRWVQKQELHCALCQRSWRCNRIIKDNILFMRTIGIVY